MIIGTEVTITLTGEKNGVKPTKEDSWSPKKSAKTLIAESYFMALKMPSFAALIVDWKFGERRIKLKSDNDKWLRKQCLAFLSSKLSDVVLVEKAGMIRDAAAKRGITGDEVAAMYRTINSERVKSE